MNASGFVLHDPATEGGGLNGGTHGGASLLFYSAGARPAGASARIIIHSSFRPLNRRRNTALPDSPVLTLDQFPLRPALFPLAPVHQTTSAALFDDCIKSAAFNGPNSLTQHAKGVNLREHGLDYNIQYRYLAPDIRTVSVSDRDRYPQQRLPL